MTELYTEDTPNIAASTFNAVMTGTSFVLSANLAKPVFTEEGFSGEMTFEPQVILHMSPQSAKELYLLIKGSVDGYEETFGALSSPFIQERAKAE